VRERRPQPLTPTEESAWRGLARVLQTLPRALDGDLVRRDGMTLTRYVVLMRLSESPGATMRMSDLAADVDLSPSRITRVVARMVEEGLVSRRTDSADARVALATLTDAGRARLEQAWPAHLAGVRSLVLDGLTDRDVAYLRRICGRLLAAIDSADQPRADGTAP
jgi:DNA-binding MarR family transcriptional regulator